MKKTNSIENFNWVHRSSFEKQTGINLKRLFHFRAKELVQSGVARKWGRYRMIIPDKLSQFIEEGSTEEIGR